MNQQILVEALIVLWVNRRHELCLFEVGIQVSNSFFLSKSCFFLEAPLLFFLLLF